jgi:Na+/H+ antiporter NhaD/arsenite permease-like protein
MAEFETTPELDVGPAGTRKQFIIYALISAVIAVSLWLWVRDAKQTIAGTIFLALVIGTLMFWKFRVGLAFIGIVLLLLTRTIDLPHVIEFMSVDVIIFLVGMMIIVGLLRKSGFFRWLLAATLRLTNFRPKLLYVGILFLSAVTAAMVDEVTSILFITALVLDLCDYFEVKPVNYVIAVVLATNIGSSWTVLGNPIGILIALRSGLTFEDFITTATPIGLVSLVALTIVLLVWQRKDLKLLGDKIKAKPIVEQKRFLAEWAQVKDQKLFIGSAIIFVVVILSLALHYRLELLFQLEKNTLLVASSIAGAGVVMLWQRKDAQEYLTKDVDWWTLVFFMFLFAKAGTIKYVGFTDTIADAMTNITGTTGGGVLLLIVIMVWFSGIVSSVMDNVVLVAAFLPIVASLTDSIGGNPILYWALLAGGCFGGNITMVGSTANIVSLGILEKRAKYHMTFRKWIGIGLWGGLLPMAVATIMLLLIYA